MFYENFKRLCSERGTTPTAVAKAIGISTSMTANWKKGGIPRADTLQKVADYFGVSVDYLLGDVRLDLQRFASPSPVDEAMAKLTASIQQVTDELEKKKKPVLGLNPKLSSLIDRMSKDELDDLEKYAEFILSKKKG